MYAQMKQPTSFLDGLLDFSNPPRLQCEELRDQWSLVCFPLGNIYTVSVAVMEICGLTKSAIEHIVNTIIEPRVNQLTPSDFLEGIHLNTRRRGSQLAMSLEFVVSQPHNMLRRRTDIEIRFSCAPLNTNQMNKIADLMYQVFLNRPVYQRSGKLRHRWTTNSSLRRDYENQEEDATKLKFWTTLLLETEGRIQLHRNEMALRALTKVPSSFRDEINHHVVHWAVNNAPVQ